MSFIIHLTLLQLTPYVGEKLYGKILATIVRGNYVYKNGLFSQKPTGQLLLRDDFLSLLNKKL